MRERLSLMWRGIFCPVFLALCLAAACAAPPGLPDGPAAFTPPEPPAIPALPSIPAGEEVIVPASWGIYSDGSHAPETTAGINRAIRDAASRGIGTVRLGPGVYLIGRPEGADRLRGIELPSSLALRLDPGAILRAAPSDRPYYSVIEVWGQSDVEIAGGEIQGDRYGHIYKNAASDAYAPTHEFGYLIFVRGREDGKHCERVYIHDMNLSMASGDGVCVQAIGRGKANAAITIRNCDISDNRRQGISLVGARDTLIEKNMIHHISGTAPQSGIDIEGEGCLDRDILIRGNRFHDNKGADIIACDGANIVLENNDCGSSKDAQIDGPIVFWDGVQITIRDNRISMAQPSANLRYGIVNYPHKTDIALTPIFIEGNSLKGCGILLKNKSSALVSRNRIEDFFMWLEKIPRLHLIDNAVTGPPAGMRAYELHDVRGEASGNTLDGKPLKIDM